MSPLCDQKKKLLKIYDYAIYNYCGEAGFVLKADVVYIYSVIADIYTDL